MADVQVHDWPGISHLALHTFQPYDCSDNARLHDARRAYSHSVRSLASPRLQYGIGIEIKIKRSIDRDRDTNKEIPFLLYIIVTNLSKYE
jgi:hypothetical protein